MFADPQLGQATPFGQRVSMNHRSAVSSSGNILNSLVSESPSHLGRTFKLSNDPRFAEKLEDVVGLYLNPPENALVLSCDEKSQMQALDRTQPGLTPMDCRAEPRATCWHITSATDRKDGYGPDGSSAHASQAPTLHEEPRDRNGETRQVGAKRGDTERQSRSIFRRGEPVVHQIAECRLEDPLSHVLRQ